MEYRYTIKDLPANSRPRERLAQCGPQALSESELLAILLRTGTSTDTVLDLANQLLAQPQGLRFLAEATVQDLSAYRGIGLAKAAQIKAAVELGRRISTVTQEKRPVVKSPQDVGMLVMEEMRFLDREHFRAVTLNTKNQVVSIDTVSIGSLNASLVHPRELFRTVIGRKAAAIILVHNHPSGDPSPSKEDLDVTRRVVEAGKLLGIEVLDHIIIGDNRFISLKEQGHI